MSFAKMRNRYSYPLILALFCVSFFMVIWMGSFELENAVKGETLDFLSTLGYNGVNTVRARMNDTMSALMLMADLISAHSDPNVAVSDDAIRVINMLKAKNRMWWMPLVEFTVVDANGRAFNSGGFSKNVSDTDSFKLALKGMPNISDVFLSSTDDNRQAICIAVPIHDDGRIVGVFAAVFYGDVFNVLFKVDVFEGGSDTYVINGDGSIISRPRGGYDAFNFFGLEESLLSGAKAECEAMRRDLADGRRGAFKFTAPADDSVRYMSYAPLGVNDWFLVTLARDSVINSSFSGYRRYVMKAGIFTAVFSLLLALALIKIFSKNVDSLESAEVSLKSLHENMPGGYFCIKRHNNGCEALDISDGYLTVLGCERGEFERVYGKEFMNTVCEEDRQRVEQEWADQMLFGDNFELQYRMKRKNGSYIWTLHKGCHAIQSSGDELACGVMIDINDLHKTQEELMVSEERYRIVTECTNEHVFEWNVEDDRFYFSQSFRDKFGPLPTDARDARGVLKQLIHTDDWSDFERRMNNVRTEGFQTEMELRLRTINGVYLWCLAKTVNIFDTYNGKLRRMLGIVTDINYEVLERRRRMKMMQVDSLTGLFHGEIVEELIQDFLSGEGKDGRHALFLIGLDDFKNVNDRFGYENGDIVLNEIACRLKQTFRSYDIIGRVGDNVFLVFLRDVRLDEVIYMKSVSLMGIFRDIYPDDDANECSLSGSIGISLYPDDSGCYKDMYQHANEALQLAKAGGKRRYFVYDSPSDDSSD